VFQVSSLKEEKSENLGFREVQKSKS